MAEEQLPLIGLAHGSRHSNVAVAVRELMAAAHQLDPGIPTSAAYLDLTSPDLTAESRRLRAAGHQRAVALPLLFTEAFHATVDVPEAVRQATADTGLELVTADILGTDQSVLAVLEQAAAEAGLSTADDLVLFAVGSSDQAANDAVHGLAGRWQARRSGSVRAAFGTTEPRGKDVLVGSSAPHAVVPLFVAPGLLMDALVRVAEQRGVRVTASLGTLLAPLVVQRYREALISPGARG